MFSLKQLKKDAARWPLHELALASNLPESTIRSILEGRTLDPRISTLIAIQKGIDKMKEGKG